MELRTAEPGSKKLETAPAQSATPEPTSVNATTPGVTPAVSPTNAPPNAPVWADYRFTCVLAKGGSTMTINLTWSDRSDNETGYIVYRDKTPIATLAANTNSYVDTAFVASGNVLSYSVEAVNKSGPVNTSVITPSCQ
jgi:hypothetical protein